MRRTPQPRQPTRIAGGVEPKFWGRDHFVSCSIFGGERGLRGCTRWLQLVMIKYHFIAISLLVMFMSCQSHDENGYVKYRENEPSFFHLRHSSILESDWVRQPENLLIIHETFKDIGYRNIIDKYSWNSSPILFNEIYINKNPEDIVDSLLLSFENYEIAPRYYSDFWKRRIKENNYREVYQILSEIQATMNNENVDVDLSRVNDTLKILVTMEYLDRVVPRSVVLQRIRYLENIGMHESIKNLVTHENHLYYSIDFDKIKDSIVARLDTATFYTYPWFEDTTP